MNKRRDVRRALKHSVLCSFSFSTLDEVKDHILTVERLLEAESKCEMERLEKLNKDKRYVGVDIYDMFGDDHYKLNNIFPSIQRNYMLVGAFSIFEDILIRSCRTFKNDTKCDMKLSDIAGRPLDKIKIYVEKIIGINFPADGVLWDSIKTYQQIRNIIVHKNGTPNPSEDKEVLIYIQKCSDISIDNKKLVLYVNFLIRVLDDFRQFLEVYLKSLGEWARASTI